jgi:tetratricopeptide (TPR) repeat protein
MCGSYHPIKNIKRFACRPHWRKVQTFHFSCVRLKVRRFTICASQMLTSSCINFFRLTTLALLLSTSVLHLHAQTPDGDAANTSFNEYLRFAQEAREAGRVNDALRYFSEALKLNPTWQEGWWNIGTIEYERDHYAQALPAFGKLATLAPQASPAWTFLGLCEFELKDYSSALEHLTKGEQLGGDDDDPEITRVAKYHLALLLIRGGDFSKANTLLTTLSARGEISPQIRFALGLCLLRVPLLPSEVDPSHEALLQDAGGIAALVNAHDSQAADTAFTAAILKYPDSPYLHYEYGLSLFNQGRTDEALRELRRESAISPESAWPQMVIARAQLRANKPPDALVAAKTAVHLAPESSDAHDVLASAFAATSNQQAAANELAIAQRLSTEKPNIEQRIAQRYGLGAAAQPASGSDAAPNDPLWESAMHDYAAGQYAEAITALKVWLQQNPNSGTGWAVLGLSEFALRDYDNSRIHLQRGQQLGLRGSPESVQLAKYHLAILLNHAGQFNAAEQLLMSIHDPGDRAAAVRFALGMSLLRIGTFPDQVQASLQSLVAAAGEVAALLKDSKYDLAFSHLDDLLKKCPSTPFLHYTYGTALAALSQFDEAEKQFRKEVEVSPSSELPYIGIASLELKRRRPAAALQPAQRAAELAPHNATAHYLLGRSYLETGNDSAAIAELEIANVTEPSSPEVHFNLAKAYAKTNQPVKAERERARFVQLNSLAEEQRSQRGNQSYGSTHDATETPISRADHATPEASKPQ